MKKTIGRIYKTVFCLAMFIATVSVNTTCAHKLYQEKLPEELNRLRKND